MLPPPYLASGTSGSCAPRRNMGEGLCAYNLSWLDRLHTQNVTVSLRETDPILGRVLQSEVCENTLSEHTFVVNTIFERSVSRYILSIRPRHEVPSVDAGRGVPQSGPHPLHDASS